MSVDRGQMKMTRMLEAVGGCNARRALYTITASPQLNQYVCEMHNILSVKSKVYATVLVMLLCRNM